MAKILIIDDDAGVRRTISGMLRAGGYESEEASDGRLGIRALTGGKFDLVITDLLMPDQEGIETIQRIRELDQEIPIIAISGSFGDDNFSPLEDAKLIGADMAIEKPFRVETLLSAVDALLA